jgi:hypothetical protein
MMRLIRGLACFALLGAWGTALGQPPTGQNTAPPSILGPITPGDCTKWISYSVLGDAGSACGTGGGGSAFNALTSGTNTTAAMLVGSGGSLAPTGSGTITANALSGSLAGTFTTLTSSGVANLASGLTQAANTSADGVTLIDSTTAATGAQQFSPRLRLTGQGWKTTATAASQETDWIIENQPIQGTTSPTSNLVFSFQVAGGGYAGEANLSSAGTLTSTNLQANGLRVTGTGAQIAGIGSVGTNGVELWANSAGVLSATTILSTTLPIVSAGTVYTIASGTGACATTSTKVGGAIAGSFVCTGTTGASTVTLTLAAVTTGYVCMGRDVTTPTTVTQTGAVSTTSVTLTMTSVSASDVIQFGCPISY